MCKWPRTSEAFFAGRLAVRFEYAITPRNADDQNFILSSWVKSYWPELKKGLQYSTYCKMQRERMDDILSRAPLVLVARDPKQPIFIYGYGVFERVNKDFVAHWVYTKEAYKRRGIAKALLAEALRQIGRGATLLVATHRTYIETDHRVATRLGFTLRPLERLYADAGESK